MLLLLALLSAPDPSFQSDSPLQSKTRHESGSARARGNLVSLFSDEDYPTTALRRNQQGMVGVRLTVGRSGRVTRCVVIKSSHVASLDAVTCQVLVTRARFEPARDRRGRPVIDDYSQRVKWRIPTGDWETPPAAVVPFVDWLSRATFTVTAEGASQCTLSDENTPTPFRIGTCADLADAAKEAAAQRPLEIKTPYRIEFALRFSLGERAIAIPSASNTTRRSISAAQLQIDRRGVVAACDPIGEVDPIKLAVLCNRARSALFQELSAETAGPNERRAVISESTDLLSGP